MYVSFLAFSEVLRELRARGVVSMPVKSVDAFLAYCNANGSHPNGGGFALLETGAMVQYLYM